MAILNQAEIGNIFVHKWELLMPTRYTLCCCEDSRRNAKQSLKAVVVVR